MTAGYRLGGLLIRDYINPGWNRRTPDGTLEPLTRRQLVLHRILWGFNKLVYIEPLAARLLRGIAGVRPALPNAVVPPPGINIQWINVGSIA